MAKKKKKKSNPHLFHIMQYLRVIFLIILISDCHIHLPTKCQWNIWILIPDIYTNGHQWWLPAHTILWKHEPEDWEKDMRGGSAIREMYLKCFHSIYCCWHFFSLGRPDTVKPANCKFTWTYDLPFSDHMPFGTLCLDMKEDISDPAFTNWFASLQKENAICGILIFHITGY